MRSCVGPSHGRGVTAAWALVGLGLGGCGSESVPPQSRAAVEVPASAAPTEPVFATPPATPTAAASASPPVATAAPAMTAPAAATSGPPASTAPPAASASPAPDIASATPTASAAPAATAPPAATVPPRPLTPAELARVLPKTFDDIKLDLQKDEPFDRSKLTPAVEALFGRRIRIRGFIHPNVPFNSGITRFVLVRDNMECCFGPGAALHDCIFVEMVPGQTIDFTTRPITIEGRFSFRELLDPIDGRVLAIYHLEGEALR